MFDDFPDPAEVLDNQALRDAVIAYEAANPEVPYEQYEDCGTCRGGGELTICANDGSHGCSHTFDKAWTCTRCEGTGQVDPKHPGEQALRAFELAQREAEVARREAALAAADAGDFDPWAKALSSAAAGPIGRGWSDEAPF